MEDQMIGKRFGRLIVTARAEDYVAPSGGVHKKYVCMCDCGNQVMVTYNSETKTLAEWARSIGIPYKVLHRRVISLDWPIERAFTQPVRGVNKA